MTPETMLTFIQHDNEPDRHCHVVWNIRKLKENKMTTAHEALSIKIAELEETLISAHPTMPTLLRVIHGNLKQDPELTTLLTAEEVSIIVRGLSFQTQTTITSSILTKGKGKALAKIGVDDI